MVTKDYGIGDPYWYEWTVGQQFIVRMLDPETGILSVTLQATAVSGIDDVVVKRSKQPDLYVQVKHTRTAGSLTFGGLVSRKGDKPALLEQLAEGWEQAPPTSERSVLLFTNRTLGKRSATAGSASGDKYTRPPLAGFWDAVSSQLASVSSLKELTVEAAWAEALDEFLSRLHPIGKAEDQLKFLRCLSIEASQPDLEEVEAQVRKELSRTLGVSDAQAAELLHRLDSALRRWATSRRVREEVTPEDLLRALSSTTTGEELARHAFPPPEPFFASRQQFVRGLERLLRGRVTPIVFLTGDPGAGKTSIVSELANRPDSPIFARFHAFRPLLPGDEELPLDAGRTTTSDSLWGALLSQLRDRISTKGELSQYNVPVRNEFLTTEQKRAHVLRIGEEVGRRRAQTTVFAIDGIDHAARAGDTPTFLEGLAQPDQVPEGVCFLIAGQDPAAYATAYPGWLTAPVDEHVRSLSVPPIDQTDVQALVRDVQPELSDEECDARARVVAHFAGRSTLAAVYGAHESKLCERVEDLAVQLERRQLAAGLTEYYAVIWRQAVEGLEAQVPLIGDVLAAALSLSSRRVTAALLADALEPKLSPLQWMAALDRLRPLVAGDEAGYRLLHNDVRVYLTAALRQNSRMVQEVARRLASLYQSEQAYVAEKHADGLRLLELCGDHRQYAEAVTPRFVIEGWAVRRPLSELEEQCEHAVRGAVGLKDWSVFMSTLRACSTLAQLTGTLERDDALPQDWQDHSSELITPLASERDVPPPSEWSLELLQGMVSDASVLQDACEASRARGLVRRWLSRTSPSELLGSLGDAAISAHPGSGRTSVDREVAGFLDSWGRLSARFRLPVSQDSDGELEGEAVAHFNGGFIEAAASDFSPQDWGRALRSLKVWFPHRIAEAGWALCRRREWLKLALLVRWARQRARDPSPGFLCQVAAFGVLAGLEPDDRVLGLAFGDLSAGDDSTTIRLLASLALVRGFVRSAGPISEVVEGASECCAAIDHSPDSSARLYGTRLVVVAAQLGQRLSRLVKGEVVDDDSTFEQRLLLEPSARHFPLGDSVSVATDLTALSLELGEMAGGPLKDRLRGAVETFVASVPTHANSRVIWEYLGRTGGQAIAESWAEAIIGPDGQAWLIQEHERQEVVDEFAALARGSGLTDLAEAAEGRCRWGAIGYSARKDYSLAVPTEWFRACADQDPVARLSLGLRLLGASRRASAAGDNRSSWQIEEEVAKAACRCGPATLWEVAHLGEDSWSDQWLQLGSPVAIGGMKQELRDGRLSEDEQLGLWCYAVGSLWWADEDDCKQLGSVLRGLVEASPHLGERLHEFFPAESKAPDLTEELRNHGSESETLGDDADPIDSRVASMEGEEEAAVALLESAVREDDRLGDSAVCRGIEVICEQLTRNRPLGTKPLIRRLLAVLLSTENRYSWHYTSAHRAVQALAPLLDEDQVWVLADWLLARATDLGAGWFGSVAEDGALLALGSSAATTEFLTNQVSELIDMHLLWQSGAGSLPETAVPRFEGAGADAPENWHELFVRALCEQLNTDSLVEARCVLAGLHGLSGLGGGLFFTNELLELHDDAKLWCLMLLEKLVVADRGALEEFFPFIDGCIEAQSASLMMQAWAVLHAHDRVTGESHRVVWAETEPEEVASEVSGGGRLMATVRRTVGQISTTSGSDAVLSRLKFLSVVTGEDVDDIEAAVVAGTREAKHKLQEGARRRRHRFADLVRERSQVALCAEEVIGKAIRNGRWSSIPLVRLAQAILPTDEPHVLLGNWPFSEESDAWPTDDHLDLAVAGERTALSQSLEEQLSHGLGEDEVVLAGSITAFSRKWDVELAMHHLARWPATLLVEPGNQTTFNGRGFAMYERSRFQPVGRESEWLTFEPGGLSHFMGGTMAMYPSVLLQEQLDWEPSPTSPLLWKSGGEDVARFEMFWGPPRALWREMAYRVPRMQRWIVPQREFDSLGERLGAAVISKSFLRVDEAPERI